jgi:[FeFe] hydrogenase H-cluster maturation GTPase HydF
MSIRTIVIFGRRNTGKSSLINSLTGQQTAIVSDIPGTTTDPVRKRVELPGIGISNIIDTAGLDDTGTLGERRVAKSLETMDSADLALILFTNNSFTSLERELAENLKELEIPFILVHNKSDISPLDPKLLADLSAEYGYVVEYTCVENNTEVAEEYRSELVAEIEQVLATLDDVERPMLEGLVSVSDNVLLVCPIDEGAPHGRLILPQVTAIREVLDAGAVATVLQPPALEAHLAKGVLPDLVVTDSQFFAQVAAVVPEEVPLTSFSMLLSRSKGPFQALLDGVRVLGDLKDGDRILMLESCTHHASCDDIGRVKIHTLIRKVSGKKIDFDFISGMDPIVTGEGRNYRLAIQCGGCMVTATQLRRRLSRVMRDGIPVTNYGMAIAYLSGILDRAVAPLI